MSTGLSLPYIISLVMLFVGTAVEAPDVPIIRVCGQHCYCSPSPGGKVIAQCYGSPGANMSADILNLPGNLSSLSMILYNHSIIKSGSFERLVNLQTLSLEHNSIKRIRGGAFEGLRNLKTLSLAWNNIQSIDDKAFSGLKNLHDLDLSFSNTTFLGDNTLEDFPSLEMLRVRYSKVSKPQYWKKLLQLRMLKQLEGVEWPPACYNCNISRGVSNSTSRGYCLNTNCTKRVMHYGITSRSEEIGQICLMFKILGYQYYPAKHYLPSGHTLACVCNTGALLCQHEVPVTYQPVIPELLLHAKYFFYVFYPLGVAVIVLNLAVIFTAIISSSMRRSVTMNLVLNIAVCDFIIGIFSILTAMFSALPENETELAQVGYSPWIKKLQYLQKKCDYLTFLFSVTQFTSVMTSFLLTLEKYLAIVYCMNPSIRITRKIASVCVFVTWSVSIGYNIIAVFFSNSAEKSSLNLDILLCANPSLSVEGVPFSIVLSTVYVVIFISTIPLYVRLYIFIRRSSAQAGVKREGAIARKIALLVLTNFVLMVVPIGFVPISSKLSFIYLAITSRKQIVTLKEKATLISILWLPLFLLSLNFSLNPILFAFRHPLFQKEFKKCFNKTFPCKHKSNHRAQISTTNTTKYGGSAVEVLDTKL